MSAKSVKSVQKTSVNVNAGGKHTRGFSLQHKTFSALNHAQDFGTTVKESLKRTMSSKWPTLTKNSNCPVSNTFMPLSALSTLSLQSEQTVIEFTNWIPKITVQFCYLKGTFNRCALRSCTSPKFLCCNTEITNVISVFDNTVESMFLLRRVSQPDIALGCENTIRFSNTIITFDFGEVHGCNAHCLKVPLTTIFWHW